MLLQGNKTTVAVRTALAVVVGCILLLACLPLSSFAQGSKEDVELSFMKSDATLNAGEMYFNVLKIWNNTSKVISGNVVFTGPENWKILSFSTDQTTLPPGDTVSIPLRVSPLTDAQGGIAYIINATFRSAQLQAATSAYVTFPPVVKWDFSVDKNKAYFTEKNRNATFKIKLTNKGNTNELVKLHLDAGKLLAFPDNSPNNVLDFVRLKAFSDTTIIRTLTSQDKVSFADRVRYENNWKESAVKITASTEQAEKSAAIQLTKLNSVYVNQRAQSSTPLNIDYQGYNLMSSQGVRHNGRMYGSVLFTKNRELQYLAGVQNYSAKEDPSLFDVDRQLVYSLRYTDNYNNIQLGYNVNGGSLHSVNGRGLTGALRLNPHNSFYYALTQNPFSNVLGGFAGYSTSIKRLSLNTEFTHERRQDGTYQANSALLGLGFSLFKNHSFSFQLLGSRAGYMNGLTADTSVTGFSYRASYNVRYEKFTFRVNMLNSEGNYIQNSGFRQSNIDSRYSFSDNFSLSLYGTQQKYAVTRYPYNFFNPVNFNRNDNLRLAASFYRGGVQYQFGPNYTGSIRQTANNGYLSEYSNYQPGMWCAATVKFGGYRSITPNLTVSNIRFYYKTNNPDLENFSLDKNIYYSAGVNYFDNVWRVNVYYTSGSATDLYRSVQVDSEPVVTRCLQFRPSYENYFFNRKVKLSAYLNYAYYMPSGRENTSFNLKYDHYFKKGWNLTLSGYMYSNTRVDKEAGRISTKDVNMFVAISKSFNIQQPRLKYYDYKAILFNDLDGNRVKSDNEPPVSDVLVTIEKDKISPGPSHIQELKLVTDGNGTVAIENLPKDNYRIDFSPLSDLNTLYFLNGSVQTYFNDKSRLVYVPLAESFKIKGKIILVRDPNSSEGKIDLNGIRVTAIATNGETYSVLTDNFGGFVLGVPNADKYKVHINNVLGENFNIDANEVVVQFTQNKTISVDFTFIEKARGIQFEGGEFFKFNSLKNDSESGESQADEAAVSQGEEGKIYSIQLAALKIYRDPSYFRAKLKLKNEVLYTEAEGLFKYYTGIYPNMSDARADIVKLGLKGVEAFAIDRTALKKARPVDQKAKTPGRIVSSSPVVNSPKLSVDKVATVATNQDASAPTVEPVEKAPVVSTFNNRKTSAPAGSVLKSSKIADKVTAVAADSPRNDIAAKQGGESSVVTTTSEKSVKQVAVMPANPANTGKPRSVQPVQTGNITAAGPMPQADKEKNLVSQSASLQSKVESQVSDKTVAKDNGLFSGSAINATPTSGMNKPVAGAQPPVLSSTVVGKVQDGNGIVQNVSGSKPQDDKVFRYAIQLDASRAFRQPSYYKEKYGLPYEVSVVEKNGERKYLTGKFRTIEEATADIARYGIVGSIVPLNDELVKP